MSALGKKELLTPGTLLLPALLFGGWHRFAQYLASATTYNETTHITEAVSDDISAKGADAPLDVGRLTTGLLVETTPDEARGGHHERGVGFRAGSRQAARSCETG